MSEKAFAFIPLGIGEGGGRIAAAFQEFGYYVAAINTAQGDLDGLAIPQERKFLLSVSQGGTGRDPNVVREALLDPELRETFKGFLQLILGQQENPSQSYFLVCVGGGGGSGSGLAIATVDLLLELNVPVAVIYTLPSNNEDVIYKMNAVNIFKKLYNEKAVNGAISPLVLVDNQYMNQQGIPITDHYGLVNRKVAEIFHMFNSFSKLPSKFFSAMDILDFGRVLGTGGVCGLGRAVIKNVVDHDYIKKEIQEKMFVENLDLNSAKSAAVIITAPEFILQDVNVSNCINFIFEEVSKMAGIVFRGVYDDPQATDLVVHSIFNGMKFPQERFNRMWEDIRKGKASIQRKETRLDEMTFDTDEPLLQNQGFQKIRQPLPKILTRILPCPNCFINPITKRSTNKYNGKGPQPFGENTMCPKCEGKGKFELRDE